MGNRGSVPGQVMQKLLDDRSKEIDKLNLQINIYQRLLLEELQDPNIQGNLIQNFENKYNNYSKNLIIDFNNSMNNPQYFSQEKRVNIINIIFRFDAQKVNVVTPTNFKLKNIFYTAIIKLNDKINYSDINNLMFSHNAEDMTKYFNNNNELNQIKVKDQDIIDVILKNNVTAN